MLMSNLLRGLRCNGRLGPPRSLLLPFLLLPALAHRVLPAATCGGVTSYGALFALLPAIALYLDIGFILAASACRLIRRRPASAALSLSAGGDEGPGGPFRRYRFALSQRRPCSATPASCRRYLSCP